MAGSDVFQTVNGRQTVDTMRQQLVNAGWDGRGTVQEAYARTTGAPVSFVGGATGVSASGERGSTIGAPAAPVAPAVTQPQGVNLDAARLAAQLADNSAQQAYLRARLNLDTDIEAHRKAEVAWRQTFDQAQADRNWAVQQAELTGVYNGAPTLAAQAEQNKTALGFLNLTSNLRGPNDPFQYLRTLQGTPRGIVDIVNAAAGRYQLGGAPSGEMAQRASVQGLIDQANAAQGGATPLAGVGALPAAGQINAQAYNQMDPSQRAALWSAYEYGLGPSGAMRPEDAQAAYLRSLPRYTFGGPTTGRVNLLAA